MKIYVSHSSSYDYKSELYKPLRESKLDDVHEIFLPHEFSEEPVNTKTFLEAQDVVLADVSYPSTGQGIELGWANILVVPIICIFMEGNKYSSSLKTISDSFLSYSSAEEMLNKIKDAIQLLQGS